MLLPCAGLEAHNAGLDWNSCPGKPCPLIKNVAARAGLEAHNALEAPECCCLKNRIGSPEMPSDQELMLLP